MYLKELIQELRSLLETFESNLKVCENFSEIIQQMNVILLKLKNLENGQTNKIIFIGRQGSRKDEIFTNIRNALLSVHETEYDVDKNTYMNFGYKNDTDELQQFESEDELSNKKEFMNTRFYNYSDELDNEIVNNCWSANNFVVVTNAVGSIGDQDRNFLKEIANKVFINKLIFIFTCMERVPDNERNRTMRQHENNAIKIANEILNVQETTIPIFFTFNDQLDANEFLLKCGTFEISSKAVKMFADNIHSYHEELKEILKKIREQRTAEKSYADKTPQGTQSTDDYLQIILGFYLNGMIDYLLKYVDPSGDKINLDHFKYRKESLISKLKKYWPESIDFVNVDFADNSYNILHFVFIIFTYYINKQFKSINQFPTDIRDNIVSIFLLVHHLLTMNFDENNNTNEEQSWIKKCLKLKEIGNKCEKLKEFGYECENLLLIDEILGFLIFVELILIGICIELKNRRKFICTMINKIGCKEDIFLKNSNRKLYEIKEWIKSLNEIAKETREKESKSNSVENEKSSSFNDHLLVTVNRVHNLINKQQIDIFNFDQCYDNNFFDIVSDTNNASYQLRE